MKYQLILQWPALSVKDYDSMVSIEDSLIERLPSDSEVDGHDGGSGQVNIFIQTDNPAKTFEDVENIIIDRDSWSNMRIAYRDFDGSEYTILWPKNLRTFDIL